MCRNQKNVAKEKAGIEQYGRTYVRGERVTERENSFGGVESDRGDYVKAK